MWVLIQRKTHFLCSVNMLSSRILNKKFSCLYWITKTTERCITSDVHTYNTNSNLQQRRRINVMRAFAFIFPERSSPAHQKRRSSGSSNTLRKTDCTNLHWNSRPNAPQIFDECCTSHASHCCVGSPARCRRQSPPPPPPLSIISRRPLNHFAEQLIDFSGIFAVSS